MILEDTEHFKKLSVLMEIQKKHILHVTTKNIQPHVHMNKALPNHRHNDPQQEFFLRVKY